MTVPGLTVGPSDPLSMAVITSTTVRSKQIITSPIKVPCRDVGSTFFVPITLHIAEIDTDVGSADSTGMQLLVVLLFQF